MAIAVLAAIMVLPAVASAVQYDSTITVNTLSDGTPTDSCSLREAITNYNNANDGYPSCASGGGNTEIQFSVSGTIALTSQLPEINNTNSRLLIEGSDGPGQDDWITIAGQCIQYQYAPQACFRQFQVDPGSMLTLSDVNLINGHAPDGQGGDASGTNGASGGSILNQGWLVLNNVEISHSQAGDGGAALNGSPGLGGDGGAIYNSGGSSVIQGIGVTLDHNRAGESGVNGGTGDTTSIAGRGGAIFNAGGTVSLTNATLAYNSVPFNSADFNGTHGGGGIYTDGGTVNLSFSTFAANSNQSTAGHGYGVYLVDGATVNFQNTIMDDIPPNTQTYSDCATGSGGGTINDLGYNLENASSCGFTGTGSAQQIDPQLQPGNGGPALQNNLGSNQTIALQLSSPAIDRIPYGTNGCDGTLSFDERGFDRPMPAFGNCDVGAFESDPLPQTITFPLPPIQENYGSTFSVNPTSSSGLPVTVSPSGPCSAKVSSTGVYDITMTAGAGTCTLTASQAGNLLYLAADNQAQSVDAAPAPLTVSAKNQSITYGGSTPNFTVSYSGFVLQDGPSSLGGTLAFTFTGSGYGPSTTPPTAVGSYTIMPSGLTSDNYSISYGAGTYTIGKANETIDVTTPAPSSAQYNNSFTVVAAGGGSSNPVTYGSSGVCTHSGATYTMTSGTGTCTVTLDQAGDGNYYDAPEVTESVIATKAPQSITFTTQPPSNPVYGDTYQPAATGGDSGSFVRFSATNACSYDSTTNTVTMVSQGTCTVAATQHGTDDYQDAPENDQIFIVGTRPTTLQYTGSQFISTGSTTATSANVTLTGTVTTEPGGTVELNQAPVNFLLYSSSNTAMTAPDATCSATVSAAGQATCTSSLAAGNWTVVMRMISNSYYTASDSPPVTVTVFVPGGKSTAAGSGWIVDPSYQNLPVSIDPSHNHGTLSFSVGYKKGSLTPSGQAQYSFQGTNGDLYTIKSTGFGGGGLGITAGQVSFGGTCSVTVVNAKTHQVIPSLSGSNYTYRIDATQGPPSSFAISVDAPDGTLYHQAGTPNEQIQLGQGQIVVHAP